MPWSMKATIAASALFDLAAAQLWPRQTALSANTTSSQTQTPTTTLSAITPPPCCWVFGGFQAVSFNTWYQQTYTETVATVITTVLQYNDTTVIANSSTRYATSTFASFGIWGAGRGSPYSSTVPGVATDLVPPYLQNDGDYAGSIIYPATATTVNTSFPAYAFFPAPTPFAIWSNIRYTTWTPLYSTQPTAFLSRYDASACGVWRAISVVAYQSTGWNWTTSSFLAPYTGLVDMPFTSSNVQQFDNGQFGFQGKSLPSLVVALPTALPNDRISIELPKDAWESMKSDSAILQEFPGITDCWTLPGEGQPTVHVPVMQLTGTSEHVITMSGALKPSPSTPVPSPTPSSTVPPISIPPASPTSSVKTGQPEAHSSVGQLTDTAAKDSPTASTRPASLPIDNTPSSPQAASELAPPATKTTTAASSRLFASPVVVVAGSSTLTLQSTGPFAAIINGATVSVGGPAVTQNGQTVSLAAGSGTPIPVVDGQSASAIPAPKITQSTEKPVISIGTQAFTASAAVSTAVVIAGQTVEPGLAKTVGGATISLASGGLVLASGTLTTTVGIAAAATATQERIITLGTNVITASIAPVSAIALGGHTVVSGVATVINGETVSLSGSQLVVAGEQSSTTIGLGGAIMSGIGGGNTGTGSSSASVAVYTGHAGRMIMEQSVGLIVVAAILVAAVV